MGGECEAVGCCFERGVSVDMVLEDSDGCVAFRGGSSGYDEM